MNANSYYQKFIIKDEHNSTLALLYIVNNPALCRLIVPFCKLNNEKAVEIVERKEENVDTCDLCFLLYPQYFLSL